MDIYIYISRERERDGENRELQNTKESKRVGQQVEGVGAKREAGIRLI